MVFLEKLLIGFSKMTINKKTETRAENEQKNDAHLLAENCQKGSILSLFFENFGVMSINE